jgi:hypothetical protein
VCASKLQLLWITYEINLSGLKINDPVKRAPCRLPRAVAVSFRISCQDWHARGPSSLPIYRCGTDPSRNGCSWSHMALSIAPPGFIFEFGRRSSWYAKVTIGMWTHGLVSICARPSVSSRRLSMLLAACSESSFGTFSHRFTAKVCGLRNTYGSVPMCETSQPPVGMQQILRLVNKHCSC